MTSRSGKGEPASRLDVATKLCEPRTRRELETRGHKVADFGQGMLSENLRRMLRRAHPPDLMRWPADFRVITRLGSNCYVDAKFAYAGNRNVTIEMRSVLAARLQSVEWFYACSTWDGREFAGFKAINVRAMPLLKGCCPSCIATFHSSSDPIVVNAKLPEKCPVAAEQGGSGTPYFLVLADIFPFGDLLFDRQPWRDQHARKSCPLCYDDHEGCGWTVGSLFCVRLDCPNPHHRVVPADYQPDLTRIMMPRF